LLDNGGRGTGFLVNHNLMLTNNHVIPTPDCAEKAVVEFNYQHDLEGRMKLTSRYSLNASIFKTNIALDYTLVSVKEDFDRENLESWGTTVVNTQAAPVPGEHVVIVQHPGGEPKQIAISDNYVQSVSPPYIRYTTDTRPGSSGAPVFNDAWQVVAIHHRSITGHSTVPGRRQKLNEGVLLSVVKQDAAEIWSGS
jgi:V8-like Glu-specific endopeptidase